MHALKQIWQREFSLAAMRARARRREAVADARWHLELWADYGDPAELAAAVDALRGGDGTG